MSPSFAVCALSLGGSTHRPTKRTSLQMAPSRLNYKDNDDVDEFVTNTVIEPQKLRTRVLSAVGSVVRSPGRRLKKRRSLSKFIFPPDEPEQSSEGGDTSKKETHAVLKNNDEQVPDDTLLVDDETYLSLTKAAGRRVIGRKKKTPQVIVKNIHELREAVLDRGLNLRDVDLEYSVPEALLTSHRGQSHKMLLGEDVALDSKDEPNSDEWQLIGNLLAEDAPTAEEEAMAKHGQKLFSHDVLNLLHKRYHSKSTPSSRAPDDTDILALSIEGGGMRGAVSGGMAAAIACLGLSNAFDSIYGSSAGSIIGSYFVSRQLYLDVYTDVIPAGKDLFVRKSKIISDIFRNMFVAHVVKGSLGTLGKKLNSNLVERFRSPITVNNSTLPVMQDLPPTRNGGLNTSFVLDAIMCPERGLRPLDLEAFAHNDAAQPLRIVSSAVDLETGELKSVCFGSKEGHFRDTFANPAAHAVSGDPSNLYPEIKSAQADENGYRRGIWACLGASMTVPGAAGNPFRMDLSSGEKLLCFDAFCYEPVPFRSAVAEGATHVLALRSRPASYVPKTKPTLYERAVAPFYFRSSGVNTPAEFFEKGGQQYLYAEDVLTCDDGLASSEAIPIPPAKVLYAAPEENRVTADEKKRENWRRAHLLPITVPADVPELSVLSQDRDDIIAGMREGFAAAYEALAPVVGLEASGNGMLVAELVFPDGDAPTQDAGVQVLPGEKLVTNVVNHDVEDKPKEPSIGLRNRISKRFKRFRNKDHSISFEEVPALGETDNTFSSLLPGAGSLPMVMERIQTYLESNTSLSLK
eukprot:CAMPEP_0201687124 /NCGR_PEP_ID=MMETSP0578-20130828/1315_1 /ASSEMBLY_ACC=CAM_ASM_000663 /TAXON_ID=267565 /ORGANISM="Skeletonema grethea, Strain CCMP 1804" /LENGTH=802 /DNA_ID=CAMNT_0048171249 /DNA_START=323 /DNA_END=2731 /DNA_ORIENTATION=-